MIWATRFLEQTNVSLGGGASNAGKGGGGSAQTVNVSYAYYANFAIGLCEGPIAFVRRIFADGNELDMTSLPIRIYNGDEEQLPDPLIVAKERRRKCAGLSRARLYRVRAVAARFLRQSYSAVHIRGDAANRGIGPVDPRDRPHPRRHGGRLSAFAAIELYPPGVTGAENRHQLTAASDWTASIDALQALCPNLESVALVVAWFGDDLRAGHCVIEPRVDAAFKTIGEFDYIYGPYWPADWSVGGLSRASARLVSQDRRARGLRRHAAATLPCARRSWICVRAVSRSSSILFDDGCAAGQFSARSSIRGRSGSPRFPGADALLAILRPDAPARLTEPVKRPLRSRPSSRNDRAASFCIMPIFARRRAASTPFLSARSWWS